MAFVGLARATNKSTRGVVCARNNGHVFIYFLYMDRVSPTNRIKFAKVFFPTIARNAHRALAFRTIFHVPREFFFFLESLSLNFVNNKRTRSPPAWQQPYQGISRSHLHFVQMKFSQPKTFHIFGRKKRGRTRTHSPNKGIKSCRFASGNNNCLGGRWNVCATGRMYAQKLRHCCLDHWNSSPLSQHNPEWIFSVSRHDGHSPQCSFAFDGRRRLLVCHRHALIRIWCLLLAVDTCLR